MKRNALVSMLACAALAGAAWLGCSADQVAFSTDAGAPDDASPGDEVNVQFDAGPTGLFDIQPSAEQTIQVAIGQKAPTVDYTASIGTTPVSIGWNVDRGEIGGVPPGPASKATFTPTGTTGGIVTVIGSANKQTVSRTVFVELSGQQNGASNDPLEQQQIPQTVGDLGKGGGVGGVGGEGLGPAVTDAPTLAALANPAHDGKAQGLAFLYPYDKTVWPRGMLAPLLMWDWSVGDADAIKIDLSTTSGSFHWSGTFARPAILQQTGGKFIHHPIPQDVWDMATNTAGTVIHGARDKLVVSVTVASNQQGYGPISETYDVAPGRLTGTVYYNSYGTRLTHTSWKDKAGNPIGAAVLSIRSGDLAPKVAAGFDSTDATGCHVCHVVASRGGSLVAQSEDKGYSDRHSYRHDLGKADAKGTSLAPDYKFAWSALTSDGALAFTNSTHLSCTNYGVDNSPSELWNMSNTPSKATMSGLPNGLQAGYPSFSPDDAYLSYIDVTGSPNDVHGPLTVASFNPATHAFSSVRSLATPAQGKRLGFPSFTPDDNGVVYETQVRDGTTSGVEGVYCGDSELVTRAGARGELWWVNTQGNPKPVALDRANGKGYLPLGPNNHGASTGSDPVDSYNESGLDDTTLNYEPTVLPVVAGGYVWVVFTSRRMYGNELQSFPYRSWPGEYDTSNVALGTTKKLWVAAIDLNAPPGTDPSYAAFYLPAQELLAGNSRGFWVLDPCHEDGDTCTSGDQCCSGGCGGGGDGGLVCSPPVGCSKVSDRCTTAADCCDSTNQCIGGYCAWIPPK